MTAPHAIFLDFDGTLAHDGLVPDAHVRAIRRARAAGHRVLLCTGRSRAMIRPETIAIGFDGVVGSAGAWVQVGDEVLLDRRIPAPAAARLLAVLDAHGAAYLLETPEGVYGRIDLGPRFAERFDDIGLPLERVVPPDLLHLRDHLDDVAFAKALCFDSSVPAAELVRLAGAEFACVTTSLPGKDDGGEVFLADVHKATGADVAARALGIPIERVIAVGDGMNDLELIAYAGLGVAIEGSDPRLLAVAARTAPPPERAGLATLFAELGLD